LFKLVDGADEALALIRKMEKQKKIGRHPRELSELQKPKLSAIKMPKKRKTNPVIAPVKIISGRAKRS
jgi:hypothetical protein